MHLGRVGSGARRDRSDRAASFGGGTLRGTLNQLQTGRAKGIATGDSESAEAIRDLIETVTLFRDPSRIGGIEVEIAGRLTALLGEEASPTASKERVGVDGSGRGT